MHTCEGRGRWPSLGLGGVGAGGGAAAAPAAAPSFGSVRAARLAASSSFSPTSCQIISSFRPSCSRRFEFTRSNEECSDAHPASSAASSARSTLQHTALPRGLRGPSPEEPAVPPPFRLPPGLWLLMKYEARAGAGTFFERPAFAAPSAGSAPGKSEALASPRDAAWRRRLERVERCVIAGSALSALAGAVMSAEAKCALKLRASYFLWCFPTHPPTAQRSN